MSKIDNIDVSVVIVSMNNIVNLFPCLDSIILQTQVSTQIIVVAYLFSVENLCILKEKYPIVEIIESNEIRGFAENNNLALRQAQGKYCLVLNDDTKFDIPVVDLLVKSMEQTPDAAIMSPRTLFGDGRLQSCGRPKMNFQTYILYKFRLWNEQKVKSPYTNQKGIFQSYNVVGAVFLIKTEVFKELGFFDETYFFCPEDIALSTLANKQGYKCYVDESIFLYHLEGGTASKIKLATEPAGVKGDIIFYSQGSLIKEYILILVNTLDSIAKIFFFGFKSILGNPQDKLKMSISKNVMQAIYLNKKPKEIFCFYYNKINKSQK